MGGGVMRAAAKVAGAGIVNTGLPGGVQVVPSSAEYSVVRVAASRSGSSGIPVSGGGACSASEMTASVNQMASWELVDDWEFAEGIEEEAPTAISVGGKPIARVLFGGVPTLEEAKEATTDLKDALDKAYISSPNWTDDAHSSRSSLISEETKDCIAYDVKATLAPKPAVHAFKLLNESPAVQVKVYNVVMFCKSTWFCFCSQSMVASIAADPNVWNAVLHNPAYMDFIRSHKTSYAFENIGSPGGCEPSSVKIEEYFDANQVGNPFLDFVENFKTSVAEMANKATDFLQNLFTLPSAGVEKGNAGLNYFEKTIGAGLVGLAVMVIMVVLLKRV
ncbi:MRNA capping enzyme family protein isoform 1 [Hibiscus syriacus]|uniref:mRNA capping enzyme family protein isoform 1 n=1 Tax=Hibiscus syriacus TaxID=106335 RepID=A0A6A2ZNH9_HIBSY|nr:MRNA capping enzyme family protein isoform 1 [Hibiscus syriacus]